MRTSSTLAFFCGGGCCATTRAISAAVSNSANKSSWSSASSSVYLGATMIDGIAGSAAGFCAVGRLAVTRTSGILLPGTRSVSTI